MKKTQRNHIIHSFEIVTAKIFKVYSANSFNACIQVQRKLNSVIILTHVIPKERSLKKKIEVFLKFSTFKFSCFVTQHDNFFDNTN